VQLRLCRVIVVVSAVDPVAVHRDGPAAALRFNFARGYSTPELAVFLIHNVTLTTDAAGIVPPALGTPVCVLNALIKYSAGG
jgi:hypothetical protein